MFQLSIFHNTDCITRCSWIKDHLCQWYWLVFNSLRPRQNGRHFSDDIFKYIFVNENVRISIKFSLKFVPKGPINNIPALVQIMAWRLPGNKPLSEPVMVSLLTHICITRPQWVNTLRLSKAYMGQNTRPSLVQMMVCLLFGTKPLSDNAGLLLIRPWGMHLSEICINICWCSFNKMHLKMLSAKWQPFCLGRNVKCV